MSRHIRTTVQEARTADMSDIEDGDIKPNCFHCGKKQNRMVKIATNEFGQRVRTKSYIGECSNPACFRYPAKASPSWIRADLKIELNPIPKDNEKNNHNSGTRSLDTPLL